LFDTGGFSLLINLGGLKTNGFLIHGNEKRIEFEVYPKVALAEAWSTAKKK
jgi:hypothetical protein